MFTKSTIPSIGENPVEYKMLTNTNRTISAFITLTSPDDAFFTVVLISAILWPPWFILEIKRGLYEPRSLLQKIKQQNVLILKG